MTKTFTQMLNSHITYTYPRHPSNSLVQSYLQATYKLICKGKCICKFYFLDHKSITTLCNLSYASLINYSLPPLPFVILLLLFILLLQAQSQNHMSISYFIYFFNQKFYSTKLWYATRYRYDIDTPIRKKF
jgi:hypothetical protein